MDTTSFESADAERFVFSSFEPNALEALVLAHRENVHSAMLAWLLRTSELPVDARTRVLVALAGRLPWGPRQITTTTEWRDLDVLVTVCDEESAQAFVAIENKLKAREHDAQLESYDRELAEFGAAVVAKVFLTLVGDAPESGAGWRPASYADLLAGLQEAVVFTNHKYLSDYRDLVGRLVASHRLTVNSFGYAAYVFGEDIVTPPSQSRVVPGFKEYVEKGRLRTTLQRAWLQEIARQVHESSGRGWVSKTAETHGAGLLDFARVVARGATEVRFGLQLQNWCLKVFANPLTNPQRASETELLAVEAVLEEIRETLNLGPKARPTADRGRGFRSFALARAGTPADRYNMQKWVRDLLKALVSLERITVAAETRGG